MSGPPKQSLSYLGDEQVEIAPQEDLPRHSFFSIEYPSRLRSLRPGEGSSRREHPALSNALCSLSPLPKPYASTSSALRHIEQLIGNAEHEEGRVNLECRLGQACLDAASPSMETPSIAAVQDTSPISTNDIYRHGIIGDVVGAHNIVLKVTKRVWKRKEKDGSVEERKEYTAHAMGITRRIARFRSMADFLYDPGYAEEYDSESEHGQEATKHALNLYDGLRKMDIASLRSVDLGLEREDYEIERDVPGKGLLKISNIKLPPPPIFDKSDVPFAYGFRHNSTSKLESANRRIGDERQTMRYKNRLKWQNLAPPAMSFSSKNATLIPTGPHKNVVKFKTLTEKLSARLKELFDRQPVWTRIALFNQFEPNQRRVLSNQKQYIAASCYTITDGCWRDCLVRFSYDPRLHPESRFFQKLSLQSKGRGKRMSFSAKRMSMAPESSQADGSRQQDGDAEEEEDDGEEVDDKHTFDGVTPRLTRGNYLLQDIHDELIRPLIYQEGDDILRDKPDINTGWYTTKHYEKIRALLATRFHHLVDHGVPAPQSVCEAALAQNDDASSANKASKTQVRPSRRGTSSRS